MESRKSAPPLSAVLRAVSESYLFCGLDRKIIEELAARSEWVNLREGRRLFEQDDPADAMYLVANGRLKVVSRRTDGMELDLGRIGKGDVVGEIQVLTGGRRTASVLAESDSELVRLKRRDFDQAAEQQALLRDRMNEIVLRRLKHNQLVRLLPPLFGSLTGEQHAAIEAEAQWVRITSGQILFRQNDPGDSFYVLVSGSLEVQVEGRDGRVLRVDHIGRGEIIGEMALLAEERRSATLVAQRDSELIRFSKERFRELLGQYPELLMQITRLLVHRLQRVHVGARTRSESLLLTVVPVGGDAPLAEFATRLCGSLSHFGSAVRVDGKRLEQSLGTPGISHATEDSPSQTRIAAWFSEQEEKHRYIVCTADPTVNAWTRRCIRQADRIVLLANGAERTARRQACLGAIEEAMRSDPALSSHARPILVLLYGDDAELPDGTAEWLECRDVETHHHVRWKVDQDIMRLARFLAGSAVGLVLGGGGARGFAHLGVVRAIEELGIPIDMIGGASMGALLGAPYAMGWSHETIARESIERVTAGFYDFTLPLTSLLAGRKLVSRLKGFFGDVQIEDLWVPYFCVSSNMSRASVCVHRRGPLWKALRASNGAVGILPPFVIDGDFHVDGGVLDNVPADVMKTLCGGKVIAVDVSPATDMVRYPSYGDYLSGWRILWSRISPFREPIAVPGIAGVLMRTAELASVANQRSTAQKTADLYLTMPLEQFQIQDYSRYEQIMEAGYAFAKPRLEEWMKCLS